MTRSIIDEVPSFIADAFIAWRKRQGPYVQMLETNEAYAAWQKDKERQPRRLVVLSPKTIKQITAIRERTQLDREWLQSALHKHDAKHEYRPLDDEIVIRGDDNETFCGFGMFVGTTSADFGEAVEAYAAALRLRNGA